MYAVKNKAGLYLMIHNMFSGTILEADLFKYFESYLTAAEYAVKHDAEVVTGSKIVEMLLHKSESEKDKVIHSLRDQIRELERKIARMIRVNQDLIQDQEKK